MFLGILLKKLFAMSGSKFGVVLEGTDETIEIGVMFGGRP
jgi:hypothetical protein